MSTKTVTGEHGIQFNSDNSTGMYSKSSDTLSITSGGVGHSGNYVIGDPNNGTLTSGSANTIVSSGTVTGLSTGWAGGGTTADPYGANIFPNYQTLTPSSLLYMTNTRGYAIFELPIKDKIPNKVYVSGRLLTLGILGSDVQVAFNGGSKLVFDPSELEVIVFNDRLTLSLDYGDWLYHYNVEYVNSSVVFEDNSNIMKARLISKAAQQ